VTLTRVDESDATYESLRKELQYGLSAATRASRARDDHHRRERHRSTAQIACRHVTRLIRKAKLNADERSALVRALARLRSAIQTLPKG
jgi:hypothetical protein